MVEVLLHSKKILEKKKKFISFFSKIRLLFRPYGNWKRNYAVIFLNFGAFIKVSPFTGPSGYI